MSSLLITGATGLAGSGVLRHCLSDNSITRITAISRSPLPEHLQKNPKLQVVIHKDFADYSSITESLKGHDMCLWCLGVSQTQVSEEQYITITHTYAIEALKAMRAANPDRFTFCFISGRGADTNERSWTLYKRIKGKTENDLRKLYDRVWSFRPGFIYNSEPPAGVPFAARMIFPIMPFALRHSTSMGSSVEEIAQSMIQVARQGHNNPILENADIRSVAATYATS